MRAIEYAKLRGMWGGEGSVADYMADPFVRLALDPDQWRRLTKAELAEVIRKAKEE